MITKILQPDSQKCRFIINAAKGSHLKKEDGKSIRQKDKEEVVGFFFFECCEVQV